MTNEKKSKWSVIVNIILTTLTAIATALGLTSCM
ncbi:MAG: smalltalk protein [Bacteroidaceae bacterium]|nr:smalltalk protein [Bacteroidaceae bacterium]